MVNQRGGQTLDEQFAAATGLERVLLIVGTLCFVAAAALLILHLGFYDPLIHRDGPGHGQILTQTQLWLVSLALGCLGGALIVHRRPVAGGVAGLAAGAGLTGSGLLYFSWRDSMLDVELLVPLLVALAVGKATYRCFGDK